MRILLGLLIAATVASPSLRADGMTAGDRQRLVAHFEMTEAWVASEIDDLSAAQLKFRATPESWSVMDVVEHLAVAEAQYWDQVQESAKLPVSTEKPTDKPVSTDAGILWYGIDRTRRDKTGEARVPTGRWSDVKESLAQFKKQRVVMLDYARTTDVDLRARRVGSQDVYQSFLIISTHAQRHILQIREIKADPNFPKS